MKNLPSNVHRAHAFPTLRYPIVIKRNFFTRKWRIVIEGLFSFESDTILQNGFATKEEAEVFKALKYD
jgi:hypothetical protein